MATPTFVSVYYSGTQLWYLIPFSQGSDGEAEQIRVIHICVFYKVSYVTKPWELIKRSLWCCGWLLLFLTNSLKEVIEKETHWYTKPTNMDQILCLYLLPITSVMELSCRNRGLHLGPKHMTYKVQRGSEVTGRNWSLNTCFGRLQWLNQPATHLNCAEAACTHSASLSLEFIHDSGWLSLPEN